MNEIIDYTFQWLFSKPFDITNFSVLIFLLLIVLIVLFGWAFMKGKRIRVGWLEIVAEDKSQESRLDPSNQPENTQDVRCPWLRMVDQPLKPSLQGAKALEQIILMLGEVLEWLAYSDTHIVNGSEEDLWRVIQSLSVERLLYLAFHSEDLKDQLKAVQELSQLDDKNAVAALKSIVQNIAVPQTVRTTAQGCLDKR